MSLKNIIFDFGGVVLNWQPKRLVESFYSDPIIRQRVWESVFSHADWLALDQGLLREEEVAIRFANRSGRPLPEVVELLHQVKLSLVPIAGTVDILRGLSAQRFPLFGLSNMPATTFSFLKDRFDFWPLFQGIVISAEEKLIKPDPRIFQLLCSRYGLHPSETLFIDDHAPNIEAAALLGFYTHQFLSPLDLASDLALHFA